MPNSPAVTLRVETDITAIAAADWDACAGPDNPFVNHAFLAAMEESGSAKRKTGWLPQHLIMADPERRIVGVVPAYVKSHSYGEYVFDHGWAQAIERAGGRYYPKLQVSVPFTPATGPRLLVRPGADDAAVRKTLIAGLTAVAENRDLSSVHATFLQGQDRAAFEEAGVKQSDIKYASIYDSFTITVIMQLEDLGFCKKGEGGKFVADGNLISGVGKLPFNTDGGGMCNNHPSNRGGITKVIEAVRQLRGEAHPKVQVKNCDIALAHGTGGSLGTRHGSASLIMERA